MKNHLRIIMPFKKQEWELDEREWALAGTWGTLENLSPVSMFSTATESVAHFASPPLVTQIR
jgi:hypothetical protein